MDDVKDVKPTGDAGGDKAPDNANKAPEKTHTQADVDKAVQDRLKREQSKHVKALEDLKKSMTGGTPDATPGTNPDGTPASDPATQQMAQQAQALMAAANQKLIQATATTEAVKLGVDPKYIGDVVKLADLASVEVGEDGTMDAGAIAKAIDEVLKRVPVFKQNTDTSGGFKVGGEGGQQKPNSNGWNSTKATEQQGKRWNRFNH